eukprot:13019446-Ditylum_brightwellii.AAC.1
MEVDDGAGGTMKSISDALLPSMYWAKVDHPTFETWKSLLEKIRENWSEVQVSFLRTAEQKFKGFHNSSTNFRIVNQRSGASTPSQKEKNKFKRACKQEKGVSNPTWRKLTDNERDTLRKARLEKKSKDRGLGVQYSTQQQFANFPSGTVLVPMAPQTSVSGQVNNATVTPATPTPIPPTQPSNAEESNQIRAANFLQMINGNFVVRNTTFTLSSTVSDHMSVQSYAQRSASTDNLWVDSGTN